ncbi:hypothetical protein ACQ4PT_025084 [Festuca glaucescens]
MNFNDVWTREQAEMLAPPSPAVTTEQRRRARELEQRLRVAERDERLHLEWARAFPEDVAAMEAFYAQKKEQKAKEAAKKKADREKRWAESAAKLGPGVDVTGRCDRDDTVIGSRGLAEVGFGRRSVHRDGHDVVCPGRGLGVSKISRMETLVSERKEKVLDETTDKVPELEDLSFEARSSKDETIDKVPELEDLSFEARSSKDSAWYVVAIFLAHRKRSSGEVEVRVRFNGFGAEEDEWINVRKSIRQESIPLESSECGTIAKGDLVLCFKEMVNLKRLSRLPRNL